MSHHYHYLAFHSKLIHYGFIFMLFHHLFPFSISITRHVVVVLTQISFKCPVEFSIISIHGIHIKASSCQFPLISSIIPHSTACCSYYYYNFTWKFNHWWSFYMTWTRLIQCTVYPSISLWDFQECWMASILYEIIRFWWHFHPYFCSKFD